ncbi:MAG: methyltransferase domain-containing protein [Rhodobacteraceae bacterium]|nr:methyltransferase domain-containing protein [Paracoccaceae bacterium]
MNCRHCHAPLTRRFLDLGAAPPSNAYLSEAALSEPETWYPLRVLYCDSCWLVQAEDYAAHDELFSADYAYFSSMSASWLTHAKLYAKAMIDRFGLTTDSQVIEIASNDGYLLQYFRDAGIGHLGVEPTHATAEAARKIGIETTEAFFGRDLARQLVEQGRSAELTAANNVLAHVPDINDFVGGFAILLKQDGVATFEFPHLLRLIRENQFDTVYHEHFSYLSLTAVDSIFRANGLSIFDVEALPTHGGSLRVFAQRSDTGQRSSTGEPEAMLADEAAGGIRDHGLYDGFQQVAEAVKNDFLSFLLKARAEGRSVAAYGAAAKGNTMLNFAGIRPDLLPFVVDRSPMKLGRYMPGSRIPILAEDAIRAARPDYVVILPWNIADEIMAQLSYIRDWGGQFVTAVPKLDIR